MSPLTPLISMALPWAIDTVPLDCGFAACARERLPTSDRERPDHRPGRWRRGSTRIRGMVCIGTPWYQALRRFGQLTRLHTDLGSRVIPGAVGCTLMAANHASMIQKRRSSIQGWGVFATQPITKNTRIIDYAGEKINNRESLKREIALPEEGAHLVLQAQPPLRPRRGGRRQRRPLHQSRLQAELLHAGDRRHDLDPRGANIRNGRRADLRLLTDGEGIDPVPVPPGLQGHAC